MDLSDEQKRRAVRRLREWARLSLLGDTIGREQGYAGLTGLDAVIRFLADRYHWRPDEVRALPPEDLAMLLAGGVSDSGVVAMHRMNLLETGTLLNGRHQYVVKAEIGRGGTAMVYKVSRTGSEKYFAAKILSGHRFPLDKKAIDVFEREVRIQRRLRHPNVLRVVEVTRRGPDVIAILEYAPHGSLYDRLSHAHAENTPIPVSTLIDWIWQLLQGAAALHRRGIVHRDITPRNVLFRSESILALSDFGVARHIEDETLTAPGDRLGSLIYISSQQRENPHEADPRDDIFSLGQIFYELATGLRPHGNPAPIERIRPGFPPPLAHWIESLRQFDRAKRPTDAHAATTEFLRASMRLVHLEEISFPMPVLIEALHTAEMRVAAARRCAMMGLLFPKVPKRHYRAYGVAPEAWLRAVYSRMLEGIRACLAGGRLRRGEAERVFEAARLAIDEFEKFGYGTRMNLLVSYLDRYAPACSREVIGIYFIVVMFSGTQSWSGALRLLSSSGVKRLWLFDFYSDIRASGKQEGDALIVDESTATAVSMYWADALEIKQCRGFAAYLVSQETIATNIKGLLKEIIDKLTVQQPEAKWIPFSQPYLTRKLRHEYAWLDSLARQHGD